MSDGDHGIPEEATCIGKLIQGLELPNELAEEMSRPVRDMEAATAHLRDLDGLAGPLREMREATAPIRAMQKEIEALRTPEFLREERELMREANRAGEAVRASFAGVKSDLAEGYRQSKRIAEITRQAEAAVRPARTYGDGMLRVNDSVKKIGEEKRAEKEREERWREDSLETQRATGKAIETLLGAVGKLNETTAGVAAAVDSQRVVSEAQTAELRRLATATHEAGRFWPVLRTQAPVGILAAVVAGLILIWFSVGMPLWGLPGAVAGVWAWLIGLFG